MVFFLCFLFFCLSGFFVCLFVCLFYCDVLGRLIFGALEISAPFDYSMLESPSDDT